MIPVQISRRIKSLVTLFVLSGLVLGLMPGSVQAAPMPAVNANAPGSMTIGLVKQTGGLLRAISIQGGYAYLGIGPHLYVVNIGAIPGQASLAAVSEVLPDDVFDLVVQGNYVYLANGNGGLNIFNISDPTHPVKMSAIKTSSYSWGVAVAGNYAYSADMGGGLTVIDVSDPAHPILKSNTAAFGEVDHLIISGNYAVMIDGTFNAFGLRILNIQNPLAITNAGFVSFAARLNGIALDGAGTAYATSGNSLYTVDVSIPATAHTLGHFDFPAGGSANSVAAASHYAYVADGILGLQIVDVTNKASPTLSGHLLGSLGYNLRVSLSGIYAYTGWEANQGLQIINISNPQAPTLGGSFPIDVTSAQEVSASGNYAYLTDDTPVRSLGLSVFDVTYPTTLHAYSTYRTPGTAKDVEYSLGSAYLADGSNGLTVVNVSNPAAPGSPKTWSPGGGCDITQVAIEYQVVNQVTQVYPYALDAANNRVYRLSMGSSILPTGSATLVVTTGDSLTSLAYDTRGYILVTGRTSGLHILPVNAATGVINAEIGHYNIPIYTNATRVTVSGNYAYIADGSGGVQIINITNPVLPTLAGAYNIFAESIEIYDHFAFVGTSGAGVIALDITDPANPVLEGVYPISADIYSLAVQKIGQKYVIYAAAGFNGVYELYFPGYRLMIPNIRR